jgi:hypothetical protein
MSGQAFGWEFSPFAPNLTTEELLMKTNFPMVESSAQVSGIRGATGGYCWLSPDDSVKVLELVAPSAIPGAI